MKKLIATFAALCVALTATAAPKKDEKDGKGKDRYAKKEMPPQMWSVVVEGATEETATEQVKAFLSGIKGVKVETIEKKDNTVEAVISSKEKVSRSDVSKAIKENKEFKVKDFKTKRPDKDGDKKNPGKTEETKKEEPKKPETTKPDAPKPDAPKPATTKPATTKPDATKPDAPKPDATKPATTKPEEPKKEE